MSVEKTEIDEVYRERNMTALAFIKSLNEQGAETGYRIPDEEDERVEETEKWPIIWAVIPETGKEVSWHIPADMLPDWLEEAEGSYDGYKPEECYKRLREYYQR